MIERHADGVTVIARSNVEAYEAASEALGQDCTITSVEKFHEGGLGGFFATELVKVHARRAGGGADSNRNAAAVFASAEDLVSSLRSKAPNFADRLLDEWLDESGREFDRPPPVAPTGRLTDSRGAQAAARPTQRAQQPASSVMVAERPAAAPTENIPSLRTRAECVAEPVLAPAVSPAPAPAATANVTTGMQPRMVDKRWSPRAMRAVGVPDRVVDIAMTAEPVTEGEWIVALMRAMRGFCGRALTAPTVMIGSSCSDLARQLHLVSVAPEELIDTVSSVAVPEAGTRAVVAGLNGREVHLVVGGSGSGLTGVEAHIVSAAPGTDMLEALRACVAWDAHLGWYWAGDKYARFDEFTVVSHIRDLVGAAEPVLVAL